MGKRSTTRLLPPGTRGHNPWWGLGGGVQIFDKLHKNCTFLQKWWKVLPFFVHILGGRRGAGALTILVGGSMGAEKPTWGEPWSFQLDHIKYLFQEALIFHFLINIDKSLKWLREKPFSKKVVGWWRHQPDFPIFFSKHYRKNIEIGSYLSGWAGGLLVPAKTAAVSEKKDRKLTNISNYWQTAHNRGKWTCRLNWMIL